MTQTFYSTLLVWRMIFFFALEKPEAEKKKNTCENVEYLCNCSLIISLNMQEVQISLQSGLQEFT